MLTFAVPLSGVLLAQEPPDSAITLMPLRVNEDTSGVRQAPLSFDFDVTNSLYGSGASFGYGFGAFGWPAAWSNRGLSPLQVDLQFNGSVFYDLITGRPRYDLLPTALLQKPAVDSRDIFAPVVLATELRNFDDDGPLTELHYQAGDHGLQRVTALHSQDMDYLVPGNGQMRTTFAYAGAAEKGEYPGSRLQRMRMIMFKTQLQKTRLSVDLTFLHNQRRLGAHSGVAGDEAVRYNRLIATALNSSAVRRDVRNDLVITALVRLLSNIEAPLVITLSAQQQRLRYNDGQSLEVQSTARRAGLYMYQDFQVGSHQIRLDWEGWMEGVTTDAASIQGSTRPEWTFSVQEVLDLGRLQATGRAGLHYQSGAWRSLGAVGLRYSWNGSHIYLDAIHAEALSAGILHGGWSSYLAPLPALPGSVSRLESGLKVQFGSFSIGPFAFMKREMDVVEFLEIKPDSVIMHHLTGITTGAGVHVGFRMRAQRGVYGEATSSIMQYDYEWGGRDRALPRWFGSATLGIRYLLFTGDLDLDVSLNGRWWGSMNSRVLHAPTGLLVLPSEMRPEVSPSGIVNVMIEGQVRTATLFVTYENLLSGTVLMRGNEIIPAYPLPAQRLRFGVFWPIVN